MTTSDFYRLVTTTRLKASGVTLADKEGIPVLTLAGVQHQSGRLRRRHRPGSRVPAGLQHPVQRDGAGQTDPGLPITFNRSFLNKPDAALASSREQEQLGKEMQEQAANLVIRQLSQVKF